MKTLIFTLVFAVQAIAMPGSTSPKEITDPEIARQLVGVAQDLKNEEVLSQASELKSCQEAYQKQAKGNSSDPKAILALETCIQQQLPKGADQLAAFSDKLNLETYKLIPSKSLQNVTKYLTKKLYQSLTGVDMEETDVKKKLQAMKFNNKKQIDHKDFYDLYKNQIAKNALYEVSRFCIQDLRRDPALGSGSFSEHWGSLSDFANGQDPTTNFKVSDSSSPPFEQTGTGKASDAKDSYKDIMRNVFGGGQGQIPDEKRLSNFFFFCGKSINKLCSEFERKCAKGSNCTGTPQAPAPNTSQAAATNTNISYDGGEKACITKTRLTAFKNAMKASEDIVKGLTDNAGADIFLKLDGDAIVKRYERGAGAEKSINELTNNASADFFQATQNESTREAEECAQDPSKCDQFVVVNDSETRIEQNTQLVYIAKREAELARVKELVLKQGQPLKEFLEKNYPDLQGKENDPNLVDLISQKWDARRVAMVKEIQDKIGARQVTQDEEKIAGKKDGIAMKNAKDSLSEKTRLAQVIFFNNIISSSLSLKNASGKDLGRNIQAFNNELDSSDSLAPGEFSNLRATLGDKKNGGGASGLGGNESVTNIDFLDQFIGIPESKSGNSRNTAGSGSN